MSSQDHGEKVTYFAETDSRNKRVKFGIKAKDRTRHVYVIGKTGMGKSTLLENMAAQDIQNGEGMAFIDPHGKTADLLLSYVPKERMKDVLYFAPFDLDNPISFNLLEDVGVDKRHLVVSGLMSTFKKIWQDAWSARMEYILTNTLLALLEYPGATLLGVNRMYADKEFRKRVVDNVKDASVKAFWVEEFAKYTDKFAAEATPAIQNKIGQFTSNPLIRNIIGQPKSSFDIRKMMDEKKILIINLSKGRVGETNAALLGSMFVTKIYLAAMSRADVSDRELQKLPNFYLFVDEFQSFANESFADILSEARKYKLNLTITHQYVEQMPEEVRSAVFGNVGTMISFRVGAFDSELLEKEFAPQFTAEDLVNLGFAQIYLKLMIDGVSSKPFSASTLPPLTIPHITYQSDIIEASRAQFGRPRVQVEEELRKWHEPIVVEKTKAPIAQGSMARNSQGPAFNKTPSQGNTKIQSFGMTNVSERGGDVRPVDGGGKGVSVGAGNGQISRDKQIIKENSYKPASYGGAVGGTIDNTKQGGLDMYSPGSKPSVLADLKGDNSTPQEDKKTDGFVDLKALLSKGIVDKEDKIERAVPFKKPDSSAVSDGGTNAGGHIVKKAPSGVSSGISIGKLQSPSVSLPKNDLKSALAALMSQQSKKTEPAPHHGHALPKTTPSIHKSPTNINGVSTTVSQVGEDKTSKEIPEELLRKVLKEE